MVFWKGYQKRLTFRTLVNQGDIFKYTVPYEQPNPSWNTLAFNDEDWLSGASGFGYDDGDDATFIPQGTTSVLVRRKFNINDIDKLNELFLDIDFDDGFVAYINGIEISGIMLMEYRQVLMAEPPTMRQKCITVDFQIDSLLMIFKIL